MITIAIDNRAVLSALGQLQERVAHLASPGLPAGRGLKQAFVTPTLPARPHCPHCGGECTVRNGHDNGLRRHTCRGRGKTFNALAGTPLARLHLRGKWFAQAAALRDGLSLNRTADRLGIAQSTAFRWRHRFLTTPKTLQAQALVGIAEANEAYFLNAGHGRQ